MRTHRLWRRPLAVRDVVGLVRRSGHTALRWFRANAFTPDRLPEKWRYFALGYLAAILAQALAAAVDVLLRQTMPPFFCESLLTLLAVVFLALTWGVGPSLLATMIGVTLVYYFRLSSLFPQGVSIRAGRIDVFLLLVIGVLTGVFTSQTQRMRRSAEQQAARLQATLAAMTDAVFVYDTAGNLLQTNAALQRVLGLDAPVHAASLHELHALISTRDEHGQPLALEQWPPMRVLRGERLMGASAMDILIRHPDGRENQVQVAGQPIFDSGGRIVGGVCVCRDVTERRQLERRTRDVLQALLAMAETLVQTPEAAPLAEEGRGPPSVGEVPTLLAGRSTVERVAELMVSALGCRRIGMFAVESETEQPHLVAAAGELPTGEHQWRAAPPAGASPEVAARLRAGEVVVLDTTPSPLREESRPTEGGRALAAPMRIGDQLVGIMYLEDGGTDRPFAPDELALAAAGAQLGALVIERERLLREREAARASALALAEANRRMDEFLGIAAHELKTPLTSLKGNIQLVARRLSDARLEQGRAEDLGRIVVMARSLVERTQFSLDRIGRLVDDLLDATRIHQGRLEFRLEPCDLAAIVREAVEEQRLLAATRAIRLEPPTSQPVPVIGDAARIGQVVTNYLTNAVKYSRENQPITVRLQVEGDVVRVSVRDEGIGVPAAEQARIWERFHRAEGITIQSGSGVGMGIGLHISRSIIEGHHGQVGLQSAPGQGSTFWFTLPLTRSAP